MDDLDNKGMEATEAETIEETEAKEAVEPLEGETVEGEAVEGDEKEPVEPWLETDEQTSGAVPVATHIKAKQKLKGRITEQTSEIEALKAKIDALEQRAPNTAQTSSGKKPPVAYDFETDDAYNEALTKYHADLVAENVENALSSRSQKEQAERKNRELSEAVDAHYERAEKLIKESGIAPEVYKSSDRKLRLAVDSIAPGKGDIVVDRLIADLGEGSEKVTHYVGNNEAARARFQSLLVQDPSGIKAAMYFGEQKARLTGQTIKSKTSKAPAPAPSANGGSGFTPAAASFKKKFDAAKDPQDMYDAKRAARLAGIDVSTW